MATIVVAETIAGLSALYYAVARLTQKDKMMAKESQLARKTIEPEPATKWSEFPANNTRYRWVKDMYFGGPSFHKVHDGNPHMVFAYDVLQPDQRFPSTVPMKALTSEPTNSYVSAQGLRFYLLSRNQLNPSTAHFNKEVARRAL